ncbi:MAG: hypothetical protein RBR40_02700 [Tenuifilaceae bacterium]|nr:hypothetical protein [Tenuifilaceae bacterium]
MKPTYNFILNDLLYNSEDKEFIDGFYEELVDKAIVLEVEYLTKLPPNTGLYSELEHLIEQTMEASHLKLNHIKGQNFESASLFRDVERMFISQIKETGFNLHKLQQDEFALYHVDVEKENRKIKFLIHTNSNKFKTFIDEIRVKANKDIPK